MIGLGGRKGPNLARILVTGASGFIGRALTEHLAAAGHAVRAAMRRPQALPGAAEIVALPDLDGAAQWEPLLAGMDAAVHLAGIAHTGPGLPEAAYGRVNGAATASLAAAAARTGLGHLVFMSSIRAQSGPVAERTLRESDPPQPTDAYGRSKLEAEMAVRRSGVPHTILRPVLVYGPQARGNFARLVALARLPVPLPFGACRNRRSLLALANLTGAIAHVLAAPAANRTFIAADAEPLSLADIAASIRSGLGRRPGLWPVPPGVLAAGFAAIGRREDWDRIGGALVADPSELLATGWVPALGSREGLAAAVR